MSPEYNTETADTIDARAFETSRVEFCPPPPLPGVGPHHMAARGLGQALGLHPLPSIMTLTVDAMLFGGTIVTGGAIWPLALVVAAVLGFITYRTQIHLYGDDSETAMIKALAVALLTGIPSSLPGFLTVPSAIVGFVHTLRRKD